MTYLHSREASAIIPASPEALFAHLDDHARLGAHMEKRSMMMLGGRMHIELDGARGQAVGSLIRLKGRVLGLELSVEEVVVERDPPRRKVWETQGRPRLLVIGAYRMGFAIVPEDGGSRLRVFIDYAPPDGWLGGLRALSRWYANWCTGRVVQDALRHFAAAG